MKKITLMALISSFTMLSISANAENNVEHKEKFRDESARILATAKPRELGDKAKKAGKEAFKDCANTCKIDKVKVKQCRKAMKAKKDDKLKGRCITGEDKKCIRKCMKKHKDKHMTDMKKGGYKRFMKEDKKEPIKLDK